MTENLDVKPESLLNLDDLLQCPVCYEIPTGQIFQCNEGHHVCGRCKMRLDVCPVCRAFFFGTRNYAMEELIANFKKVKTITAPESPKESGSSEGSTPAIEAPPLEAPNIVVEEDINSNGLSQQQPRSGPPQACKGLFRCLCCKSENTQRLPAGRLLNHLRYFHRPDLIEGRSENGEYLQVWQFPTSSGRLVTAVRIADMGVFFLVIEIVGNESLHAWLTMASSPWVAHSFTYSITISGNDREAIFSDSVWSVRSCEGSLKKRGHCLAVTGSDARALLTPVAISGKLSVRRLAVEQLASHQQPRAVLRIANRGNTDSSYSLDPYLQQLQSDVERLSRVYATLSRENIVWSREDEHDDSNLNSPPMFNRTIDNEDVSSENNSNPSQSMSRSARRRMRQRLRAALNLPQAPGDTIPAQNERRLNGLLYPVYIRPGLATAQPPPVPPPTLPSSSSGPSNGQSQSANRSNRNRRYHRR